MLLFNLYCLIITFLISQITSSSEKIRFVFEICRHGARTPYSGLKINENFSDYFSFNWSGIKELTPLGIRQHFYLGLRNRIRYLNSLLSDSFDPREILVYSTNSNRTILSANAQLQGLYLMSNKLNNSENDNFTKIQPLSEKQIENSDPPDLNEIYYKNEKEKLGNFSLPFKMTIVPIHLLFSEDHIIQIQDEKNCPNLKKIYNKRKKRKEIKIILEKLDEKYSDFIYPIIKNNLDFEIKDEKKLFSNNYSFTYNILDQIICHYTNGFDVIEEHIKKYNENNKNKENLTIENLIEDSYEFFKLDFLSNATDIDEEIGLYSLSPIMEMLINYMKKKVDKDKLNEIYYIGNDVPKFLFVSAHDSTVGGFQAFFKYIDKKFKLNYAYFASNIFIELFYNCTENFDNNFDNINESCYYVRFLFDDVVIREYKYEEFYNLIKSNIKDKYEIADYCGFNAEEVEFDKYFDFYLVSTVLLSCLCLALIMISINLYLKRQKIKKIE